MSGLIIAEVEFPNQKAFSEFNKPSWFDRDVTQERWVAGNFIAGKTYEEILGYIKQS